MNRITDIKEIKEGTEYLALDNRFTDKFTKVRCISLDYTGLNRDIIYMIGTNCPLYKVMTKEMFVENMKANIYINGIAAIWSFELDKHIEIKPLHN